MYWKAIFTRRLKTVNACPPRLALTWITAVTNSSPGGGGGTWLGATGWYVNSVVVLSASLGIARHNCWSLLQLLPPAGPTVCCDGGGSLLTPPGDELGAALVLPGVGALVDCDGLGPDLGVGGPPPLDCVGLGVGFPPDVGGGV